jgi:hypothetical protein
MPAPIRVSVIPCATTNFNTSRRCAPSATRDLFSKRYCWRIQSQPRKLFIFIRTAVDAVSHQISFSNHASFAISIVAERPDRIYFGSAQRMPKDSRRHNQ